MRIKITGTGVKAQSLDVIAQERINFYGIKADGSGRVPPDQGQGAGTYYAGRPGLTAFADLGTAAAVIGLYPYNGKLYAVSGSKLYEVTTSGTVTAKGSAMTISNSRVSMVDNGPQNGKQLMIACGTKGYVYDSSAGTLTEITASGFPGADYVTFIDGYGVVNNPGTGEFFKSGAYDFTSWNALDFATAEGAPDNLVRPFADHEILHLFGTNTKELWYDTGALDFPFERYSGGLLQTGTIAGGTIARLHTYKHSFFLPPYEREDKSALAWLAQNEEGALQVVASQSGQDLETLSSPQLEAEIAGYSTVSDAFAFTMIDEGQEFYVLTFPTADRTWVLNARSGEWDRWSSSATSTLARYKANCHAYLDGVHYVGDYSNGKIYTVDSSAYTDDGTDIYGEIIGLHIQQDRERVFISEAEFNFERGVGNTTVNNPAITVKWSKDGGHTYTTGRTVNLGASGAYTTRAIVRRLGMARNWTFALSMTSAFKRVAIDAHIRVRDAK